MNSGQHYSLDQLLELMSRLRDPNDGCPWDGAQTFTSLAPYLLEESYELVDAVERGDHQHMKEELGDVLFQVIFYAQLAAEQKHFDFADIVSSLTEKLLRRHPHVFPDGQLSSRNDGAPASSEQIHGNWEATKSVERGARDMPGMLDDIPLVLPALSRAAKMQKRVSRVGFDWAKIADVLAHFESEVRELVAAREQKSHDNINEELGDVLFSAVNLARHLKVDPETALRRANRKFDGRFSYIEQQLKSSGQLPEQASLELMDALWDQAKAKGL